MAELNHNHEQAAIEEFITRALKDLSRPNALRLKAGLQILMTADISQFEATASPAMQRELADFKNLLLHPEQLAPESCRTEAGKSIILLDIKTHTLNNLSLLDERPTLLSNVYTVLKTLKGGERLKSVLHTSAIRNVVTAAHYVEAIEARFKAEGYQGQALQERVQLATQAMANLHTAVLQGNLEAIKKNLSIEGVDVNLPNPEGLPLLHLAIRQNNAEVTRLLLTVPTINVNLASNNGWAPLHLACRLGFNEVVKLLLTVANLQVNIVNSDGWTPLHWAAWHGFTNVIISLLAHPEIEVNPRDSNLCAPLHWAARNGHADVVAVLLADPKIDPNPIDNELKAPLHYAICYDHAAAASSLLTHPNISLNLQDSDGLTPLHWAARNGRPELVDLLLEMPAIRLDLLDNNQMTAGDWARRNEFPELLPKLMLKVNQHSRFKNWWEKIKTSLKQMWNRG